MDFGNAIFVPQGRCCVFDNPQTQMRECWHDGRMTASYAFDTLTVNGNWPPPARVFFFGMEIGPWKPGQLVGDRTAMSADAELFFKQLRDQIGA